jgi:hypothetical protein
LDLAFYAIPLFSVGWRLFLLSNIGPDFGQLGIEFKENFLACGQFILRENSLYWALWLTQCTIDAFIWVNDQKVRAFVKAIYRADFDTVRVLTLDAVFANNEGHRILQTIKFSG